MANPFPFVSGSELLASQLNGIGEATAYTPTTTNVTLGNGLLTGRFMRVQKLVHVRIELVFGSTTSFTAAGPGFSLPVNAAFGGSYVASGVSCLDAGVTFFLGGVETQPTAAFPFVSVASATFLQTPTRNISATVPMTWGSNDRLIASFVYEAA